MTGFIVGVISGILSFFFKPIIALYDLIKTILEGISNSAKFEEHVMDVRSRPPRIFGENK